MESVLCYFFNIQWILLSEKFLVIITFILLFISYLIGYKTGLVKKISKPQNHASTISTILAGLMALLGILLAFSFSMSSSRFDQRKQLIIDESLNIGTAYFRVGLLEDAVLSREIRNLLKTYLNQRIYYYQFGHSEDNMNKHRSEAEDLQVQIWIKTAIIGRNNPSINTSLISQSLNSMIDVTGAISGSMKNHVPYLILLMLILISAFTIFTIGYTHGLVSDRNVWFASGIIIVICIVLLLIVDMDSPFTGPIKVNIDSLIDLQNQIQRYDP